MEIVENIFSKIISLSPSNSRLGNCGISSFDLWQSNFLSAALDFRLLASQSTDITIFQSRENRNVVSIYKVLRKFDLFLRLSSPPRTKDV
jgi:hypothetical protein